MYFLGYNEDLTDRYPTSPILTIMTSNGELPHVSLDSFSNHDHKCWDDHASTIPLMQALVQHSKLISHTVFPWMISVGTIDFKNMVDKTFTADIKYRLKKASRALLVISRISPGDAVYVWTIKLMLFCYYWYCLVLPVGRLPVAIVLILGIAVAGVVATNEWTTIIIIILYVGKIILTVGVSGAWKLLPVSEGGLHCIPSPIMATSVGMIMQVRFHWCKHLFSIVNRFNIDQIFYCWCKV